MITRKLETLGLGALVCAWLVYGSHMLGEVFVHVDYGEPPAGFGKGEDEGGAATEATAEPEADLGTLLAAADPAAGEKVFGKCKSCHTIEAGGPNRVGPNLHNVVGNKVAAHSDFAYSSAMSGLGGTWTYENLDHFLANPKAFAPGTKMTFAGLAKATDRAEVISYLRANTENPPPLPAPVAAAAPAAPTGSADTAPGATPPAGQAGQ